MGFPGRCGRCKKLHDFKTDYYCQNASCGLIACHQCFGCNFAMASGKCPKCGSKGTSKKPKANTKSASSGGNTSSSGSGVAGAVGGAAVGVAGLLALLMSLAGLMTFGLYKGAKWAGKSEENKKKAIKGLKVIGLIYLGAFILSLGMIAMNQMSSCSSSTGIKKTAPPAATERASPSSRSSKSGAKSTKSGGKGKKSSK